jgi:hypothetical protein
MISKLLILSGGSLNGLAYLGMFRYLESKKMHANQFKIYGSSIGGILGMFWNMGYDSEMMIRVFAKFPFFPSSNVQNLITNGGLDDGKNLENLFIDILKLKFSDITNFNEFTLSKFPNIYLCTCDVYEKKTVYLSSEKFPDLPIHLALRMTCNLPFIFEPVIYMNHYYVDGGIIENIPLPPPNDEYFNSTVIFCIFEKKETNSSYFQKLVECSGMDRFYLFEKYITKIFSKCLIIKFPKTFEIYDFWVSVEDKNNQILEGYRLCKNNIKLNELLNENKLSKEIIQQSISEEENKKESS